MCEMRQMRKALSTIIAIRNELVKVKEEMEGFSYRPFRFIAKKVMKLS